MDASKDVALPELMLQAEQIAKLSPCSRRQYGAIIAQGPAVWISAFNERVGRCCDGNICIRERDQLQHVEAIERGAEVHAEAAALLRWGKKLDGMQFYLAGFRQGQQLKGDNCKPCHYCAMMMIYSGFDTYIIKDEHDELIYKSTWETMEEHEATYWNQLV